MTTLSDVSHFRSYETYEKRRFKIWNHEVNKSTAVEDPPRSSSRVVWGGQKTPCFPLVDIQETRHSTGDSAFDRGAVQCRRRTHLHDRIEANRHGFVGGHNPNSLQLASAHRLRRAPPTERGRFEILLLWRAVRNACLPSFALKTKISHRMPHIQKGDDDIENTKDR